MKRLGFDLIILGDPTAGKDTQAAILMKKYSLQPVESGKQWRVMVKKNDSRGRWLRRTFGKGYPTPVAIVKWFLKNKVKSAPKNKDLIFIGNPRLKPEAQFLVKLLEGRCRDFFVLYLKLPEKEVYLRAERRMAQEDDRNITKKRIAWHKVQVSKTVKYFQSHKKLKYISGQQSIKKVELDIQKAINDYSRSKRN